MKRNKGITLIALVVTIIVLIILAGISIKLILGENGIITRAQKAKIETDKANAKEKVQMAVWGSYGTKGELEIPELRENLRQTEGVIGADNITKLPATVNVDGYDITIDEQGNVSFGSGGNSDVEPIFTISPIYARSYTKNSDDSEVLALGGQSNSFDGKEEGLTLKEDYGNIFEKIPNNLTMEDLYNIPEIGEFLKSDDFKEFDPIVARYLLFTLTYGYYLRRKSLSLAYL